jgi:hypothetical protein
MARKRVKRFLVKKQYTLDLRAVFPTKFQYQEYLEFERNLTDLMQKEFTRFERVIYFFKCGMGYGRRKIRMCTGISERQVGNFYKRVYDMYEAERGQAAVQALVGRRSI